MEDIAICSNFWCKCQFTYIKKDNEPMPKICPKCFDFDFNLSDGITHETKRYEGSRNDGRAHRMSINVHKYSDNKKW